MLHLSLLFATCCTVGFSFPAIALGAEHGADTDKTPLEQLFSAIQSGNDDKLRDAVAAHPTAINQSSGGSGAAVTPLHAAACGGRVALLEILVNAGATVDIEDSDGMTPLFSACRLGHVDAVKFLLAAGSKPNHPSRSIHGHMPLDHAASNGQLHVVKVLLDQNATVDGESALARAIGGEHWPVVEELLTRGADPNRAHAMLTAAERAPATVLARMIERGGDVNTPHFYGGVLSKAAGSLEKVTLLVAHGADVNGAYKNGHRPLDGAAQQGNVAVIKFLISRGAVVDQKKVDGQRPLDIAIRYTQAPVIEELLAAGAAPSFLSQVALGHDAQVRRSLEANPKLREQSLAGDNGLNAVVVAVRFGQNAVLKTLLDAGASANADHYGTSALHLSIEPMNDTCLITMEQLLTHGADPNGKLPNDRYVHPGFTPLHSVVSRLSPQGGSVVASNNMILGIRMIELLLKHGGDLDAASVHAGTPREMLKKSQHPFLTRIADRPR